MPTARFSGNALKLAQALGGDQLRDDGAVVPGPGHSSADRSLRVWLDHAAPDGFQLHSFAGDDWRACRDYIREKLKLPGWQGEPRVRQNVIPNLPPRAPNQRKKALWCWQQSASAQGTIVERYLRSREIVLPDLPATIRYLPARPPKYMHPAMIAPFAILDEPEPGRLAVTHDAIKGIHLTFLRADGTGKAGTSRDKIMVGSSVGTPIVIAPMGDELGLAITEGIEDALSLHAAIGLGAWAAGSAVRMPALADAVPICTDCVTVIADADDAGQQGACELARRLESRGIKAIAATLANGGR